MDWGLEQYPGKRGLKGTIIVKRAEYSLGRKGFVEGNARQVWSIQSGGRREKKVERQQLEVLITLNKRA